MIVFTEVIQPPGPIAPLSHEDEVKLIAERLMQENLWIEDFIARLEGTLRDIKLPQIR
jgi:hypothetical protein